MGRLRQTLLAYLPVETPVKAPARILVLLQAQPEFALAEVAQAIGMSLGAVERAAKKLQAQERFRYVGPKRAVIGKLLSEQNPEVQVRPESGNH